MKFSCCVCWFAILVCALALGQGVPVPFISQPLVPTAVAPGGAGFTLTVNGTGFVQGSVVKWNGSPRATTFVSSSQVTAKIFALDIAVPGTASITVANPLPGGGASNAVFFQVAAATVFGFGSEKDLPLAAIAGISTADLNRDGMSDLVTFSDNSSVSVFLGEGSGTFAPAVSYTTGVPEILALAIGDVNNDGIVDVVAAGETGGATGIVSILLGNDDGTFRGGATFSTGITGLRSVALGDFDGNGDLDIATIDGTTIWVSLGRGDGTFPSGTNYGSGISLEAIVAGDFNQDGKLDLATSDLGGKSLLLSIGNGNGSFRLPVNIPVEQVPDMLVAADFNDDGKLDLVQSQFFDNSIAILLDKGDGTFQSRKPTQPMSGLVRSPAATSMVMANLTWS